jgi:folate-binding protein YgfZ
MYAGMMPRGPNIGTPVGEPALRAARDAAVVCDLDPLRVLAVTGTDAAAFLNGQLSIDTVALQAGTCRYGCFNSPKGRMLANFVVWRDPGSHDRFLLLLPGEIAPAVAKRLSMYVLRSKVTIADTTDAIARFGVGGPDATRVADLAWDAAPSPFELRTFGTQTVMGLPGPRFVVIAPAAEADATRSGLLRHASAAPFGVWRWLTIRAGVPVITAATQDMFVAQTANWDVLQGIDFQKGCYTGQEIIARTQYLGRLKERAFLFHAALDSIHPGERLYSAAFGDQPCGTVVDAAPAPDGGCDLIAVLQIAAAERGEPALRAPDGPALSRLPLPYALPAPAAPRSRRP